MGFANCVAIVCTCGHTTPASSVLPSVLHRRVRAGLPGSGPGTHFFTGSTGTRFGLESLQQPPRCSSPVWPMLPGSILLSRQPRILDPCDKRILCQPRPGLSIKTTLLVAHGKPIEELGLGPPIPALLRPSENQNSGGRAKTFQQILRNRKQPLVLPIFTTPISWGLNNKEASSHVPTLVG